MCAVAALLGCAVLGVLLRTTPLSDWLGYLSNPLNWCGYDIPPLPSQYRCLAFTYGFNSVKLFAGSAVVLLVLALTRRVLLATVTGAVLAVLVKVASLWNLFVYFDSLIDQPGFVPNELLPQVWAAAVWALLGGTSSLALVTVWRAIAPRPS